jgi:hypothetical protein
MTTKKGLGDWTKRLGEQDRFEAAPKNGWRSEDCRYETGIVGDGIDSLRFS